MMIIDMGDKKTPARDYCRKQRWKHELLTNWFWLFLDVLFRFGVGEAKVTTVYCKFNDTEGDIKLKRRKLVLGYIILLYIFTIAIKDVIAISVSKQS